MKNRTNELKNTLINKGWDYTIYIPIYNKCIKGAVLTNKNNNEYSSADHLYELGFMEKTLTPIVKNGSFLGNKITFQSI